MTHDPEHLNRLRFLLRVVQRERKQLQNTDRRVFDEPFTVARARQLDTDVELSERIEAFASRFSRLQDTVGDKLIPVLLRMLGESPGAAIDNFDRAERLGWLASADEWMSTRLLRNQMIHGHRRSRHSRQCPAGSARARADAGGDDAGAGGGSRKSWLACHCHIHASDMNTIVSCVFRLLRSRRRFGLISKQVTALTYRRDD